MIDVRLRGFSERAPLAEAWAWIDALPILEAEPCASTQALGRVLAAPIVSPSDLPNEDRAAINGYAVTASEIEGASAYNPIAPASGLHGIASGDILPPDANAILPFGSVEAGRWAISETMAGEGVTRRGDHLRTGADALPAGRLVRAVDVALLEALHLDRIMVRRMPRVRLRVSPPKSGPDLLTPLLTRLLARDGAVMSAGIADLIIIAGRSGTGANDDAAETLATEGGRLERHGIAIRPGGSSGFGWLGATPVLLLPGEPLACLAATTLFVVRALHRMTGRIQAPPITAALSRKLVSGVGYADFACVRLRQECDRTLADPLPTHERGLPVAAQADGYVLVPETSEGYAAGTSVEVQLL